MRPKKVILCICENELDLSVLIFTLTTNGYATAGTTSPERAVQIFADQLVDLVLTDFALDGSDGVKLIDRLKSMAAHIPMVLMVRDMKPLETRHHHADALVSKKTCSPAELLECLKLKCARKRGPRKGYVRPPAPQPVNA